MRSSNTYCASGNQLVGDELLDISSVYVHERAVKSFKLPDYYVVYLLIPTFIVSNYVLSIGSNSCSSVVKYGSFLYGSDDCFNLRILPVFPSNSVFASLLSKSNVRGGANLVVAGYQGRWLQDGQHQFLFRFHHLQHRLPR